MLKLRGTLRGGRFSLSAAGRPVPTQGNDDGFGATFQPSTLEAWPPGSTIHPQI